MDLMTINVRHKGFCNGIIIDIIRSKLLLISINIHYHYGRKTRDNSKFPKTYPKFRLRNARFRVRFLCFRLEKRLKPYTVEESFETQKKSKYYPI